MPAALMPPDEPPDMALKLNVPVTVIGPTVAPLAGMMVVVVTLAVTEAGITSVEKLPVLSVADGKFTAAMLKLPPVATGVLVVSTISVWVEYCVWIRATSCAAVIALADVTERTVLALSL